MISEPDDRLLSYMEGLNERLNERKKQNSKEEEPMFSCQAK